MNKGIAVTTILTLVVGIVVVGIIIYLVYTYVLTPVIPEQDCRAMAISWCTSCRTANGGNWTLDVKPEPFSTLKVCAKTYFTEIPGGKCKNNQNWCKNFIPV